MTSIPLIDLQGNIDPHAPLARESAARLHEALSTIGFAYIAGHNVSSGSRQAAFAASREFHASPLERKQSVAINAFHRGYMGMATEEVTMVEVAIPM